MPWVKLDEQFRHHPKIVQAGAVGIAMYVCGLSYAAEYLTDGFVSRQAVRTLIDLDDVIFVGMHDSDSIDPIDVAHRLVDLGLWDEAPGGFRIHDYLDYNPSKVQVMAERAVKQAAGRAGGQASATARATPPAKASADTPDQAKSNPVTVPVSVSDSVSIPERENARATNDPWDDPEHEARVWLSRHGCDVRPGNGYDQKLVTAVEQHGINALIGMFDRLANAGTKAGDIKGFLFGAIDALDAQTRPNLRALEKEDDAERAIVSTQRQVENTHRQLHEIGQHQEQPRPGCPLCKVRSA
jgi:hypothetical protein